MINSMLNADRTSGIIFKIKSTINQRTNGLQNDRLIFLFRERSLKNNHLCCQLFLIQHNASSIFFYIPKCCHHSFLLSLYSFCYSILFAIIKRWVGIVLEVKTLHFRQILQKEKGKLSRSDYPAINFQCCKSTTRERYYCIIKVEINSLLHLSIVLT